MKSECLVYLACPTCEGSLEIEKIHDIYSDDIRSGLLLCSRCKSTYEIVRSVPRFVPIDKYASGFGLEWTKHKRTQYDTHTGLKLSERRFFEETKWGRNLHGESILEVGSGSGRFTEQAAKTGAFVVSMDYSYSVDSNYEMNGYKRNVLIIQADIHSMPFKKAMFDKVLCLGVLQHTPDPYKGFTSLLPYLKDGGSIVIDVYKKTISVYLAGKYYVRPLVRKMDPAKLYEMTRRYIDFMWPICSLIRRIPKVGRMINWALLVADHSNRGLEGQLLKEWAYLDTFDMLSPQYDYPQSIGTVREWFRKSGLTDVQVSYGYNGIEGRGRVAKRKGSDSGQE